MPTTTTKMTPAEMDALVDLHLAAEMAGDVDGSVAMYTPDVEHDVVGSPDGVLTGPDQAKEFYEYLTQNVKVTEVDVARSYHGDDFCVIEHDVRSTVPGEFLGVPGNGREIQFRMLHVWEFRDGAMSREQVWLDGSSIVAQLTAPDGAPEGATA